MTDRTPARPDAAMRSLRAAPYWLAVAATLLVWHELLRVISDFPFMVHAALVGMVLVAGLWGHSVLFAGPRAEAKPAAEQPRLAPASLVLPAQPPAPLLPATPAAPEPPAADPTLRDLVRAAMAELDALTDPAALTGELSVRRDFDAEFAAAADGLGEEEERVLALCARRPAARGHLRACADLVRLLHRFGADAPADPGLLRMQEALSAVAEPLAQEFRRIMSTTPDLDPVEVSRRLLERHAGVGTLAGALLDETRLADSVLAGTGQRVVARLVREAGGTSVVLLPEPPPEARLPLALALQFCGLVAQEARPAQRAALAAALQGGAGPALRQVIETYVREAGRQPAAAAASAGGPPAAPRMPVRAEPAAMTRWQLIDRALPATGRAA
jgi:hypothetical protein